MYRSELRLSKFRDSFRPRGTVHSSSSCREGSIGIPYVDNCEMEQETGDGNIPLQWRKEARDHSRYSKSDAAATVAQLPPGSLPSAHHQARTEHVLELNESARDENRPLPALKMDHRNSHAANVPRRETPLASRSCATFPRPIGTRQVLRLVACLASLRGAVRTRQCLFGKHKTISSGTSCAAGSA